MNYDLTGGNPSPKKPQPIEDNYSRNDIGLRPNGENVGIAQENIRQDVNGSTDKPFPQERNWVFNPDPDMGYPKGITVIQEELGNVANKFGQVKYAKRAGAISIYKDKSRNTANDAEASRKTEMQPSPSSTEWNDGEEGESAEPGYH